MKHYTTIDFKGAPPTHVDPLLDTALWMLASYQYAEVRQQMPNLPDWVALGYEGRREWRERARRVVEFNAERDWWHGETGPVAKEEG